ncbi:MAG: flagellar basal body-associated FliL family protein [Spongiibacteraceae bacterium]
MAKNEEDDVTESDEEIAAKAVEAAARKKKMIMLGVIGLVLLLLAGGGTWFALGMLKDKGEEPVAAEGGEHAPAEAKKDEHAKEEHGKEKKSVYDVLEPSFLANYQVDGRTHYLQVSLAVMAREEDGVAAVKKHMPLVRNRIVMLLSGEAFEQLQTDEGRTQLQQKLLKAIQEIMQKETGKPQIEQVYFTTFVMQ